MRHEDWLALFADRDEARAKIREFLRELAGPLSKPPFPILQVYGLSGQGKTSLFYQTQFEARHRFPNTCVASLDLADLSAARASEPVEVLWDVTHALADVGIMAPLSFCLYAHYWRKQNAGQEFRLQDSLLSEYLERCIRGCEALSPFTELIHLISDVGQSAFKFAAAIQKFFAARNRAKELKIADLRRNEPGDWEPERIEGSFSEFLALDILVHLRTHRNQTVCLMLDTFDRLEPASRGDSSERFLQDLCSLGVEVHQVSFDNAGAMTWVVEGYTIPS